MRAREAEHRADELLQAAAEHERRGHPTPEALAAELVAQEEREEAQGGRYYLLDHPNPNGALRANGKYGWYYLSRSQPVRGIVIHTAESMDAFAVAGEHATADTPAAAHVVVDTEATVPLLRDETTSLDPVAGNSAGLGIEIAYRASLWGTQPETEELLLIRSAAWCGVRPRVHGIPIRRVTIE